MTDEQLQQNPAFYQISPSSYSFADLAETLQLIWSGGTQFFHAHTLYLLAVFRSKRIPEIIPIVAPSHQPCDSRLRCSRKIGCHQTKSTAKFQPDRRNYMKRGFIGKMLDLAERTIQNCGFGMFLQKKIQFRGPSSSKHSSILFSQREGPSSPDHLYHAS
jgi:hypothetical protein